MKKLFLLMSILVPVCLWADPIEIDGIYYNLIPKANLASVARSIYSGDIVIPSTVEYEGKICNVTSIEERAFYYSEITSITIPSSIKEIGNEAFGSCNKFGRINIEDLTSWCNINFKGQYANPLSTGHNLYCGGELITSLDKLPDTINTINKYAFYGCYGFDTLIIPNHVKVIGGCAFTHCDKMSVLTIPESVDSIATYAFSYCTNLDTVIFDKSSVLKKIELGAFSDCKKLRSLTIPKSIESIAPKTFVRCSSLSSIFFEGIIKDLGMDAFFECSALESVAFKDGLLSVGDEAFYGCKKLSSIYLPNTVSYLGQKAFNGCEKLKSIVIPPSITAIYNNSFNGCKALSSLVLPNSITRIENYAFNGCSSLKELNIPSKLIHIGDYSFNGCSKLETIYLEDLAAWCNVSIGTSGNPMLYASVLYLNGVRVDSLVIPNSVKKIQANAFYKIKNITSVTIPDGVETIEMGTFYGCDSLTSVYIGNTLVSVGNSAFASCTNLATVSLGYSVTSIGEEAFYGCKSLKEIIIPNSVTDIKRAAFYNCIGLKKVIVGNGIATIGYAAFANCIDLTDFYCYAVPSLKNDVFKDSHVEYSTLHVKSDLMSYFVNDNQWKAFGNIVSLTDEELSVKSISNSINGVRRSYSLDGKENFILQGGVNIIKTEGGDIKKVKIVR